MTRSSLDVIEQYVTALISGDAGTAMSLLHPQAVWHQPGANRFSGTHTGRESIGALIGGMMEVSQGSFTLQLNGALMANGNQVAVPVRFTGQRGELHMDTDGVDLLTVEDGLITQARLFTQDGAQEDRFWGAG